MNMQPRISDSSLTKDGTKVETGPKQHTHASSLANGGSIVGSGHQDLIAIKNNNTQDLRKNLTLDFTTARAESSKKTLPTPELISSVLRSTLTSPENEKLGLTNQGCTSTVVTTPTPTTYFFPNSVTAEQESYARGFLDALNQLHQKSSECIPSSTMLSPGSVANTVQFAEKGDYNESEEQGLTVEQIFRLALQSSAVNSNVQTPSTISITNANSNLSFSDSLVPAPRPLSIKPPNVVPTPPTVVVSSFCDNIDTLSVVTTATTLVKEERLSPYYSDRCHSNSSSCSSASSTASSCGSSSYSYQSPQPQLALSKGSMMDYTQLHPVTFGNVVPGNMLPTTQYITLSSGNGTSQMLGNLTNHPQVKMENMQNMHHVQNYAGISPMDPTSQEKLKLERKRARNRLAATKCRKRKIERIETLQDEVKKVHNKNDEIEQKIVICRQNISILQKAIKEHERNGCVVFPGNNNNGKRRTHNM